MYKTILRRMLASLIDSIPLTLYYYLVPMFGRQPTFIVLLFPCIWYYAFYIAPWQVSRGQTVGMWVSNIRVIQLDGSNITFKQAFIRIALEFILSLTSAASTLIAVSSMSLSEYTALSHWDRVGIYPANPFIAVCLYIIGSGVTLLAVICMLAVFFNKKKRTLYDFVAGTVVVRTMAPRRRFSDLFKKS
ncbi:MAG: RDD family protein [Terrimicrobiaceae bacterium]